MTETGSRVVSGGAPTGLIESRLDYRRLVESLGDAVYVLDCDGCFTYLNGAFLEMLGYGVDEAPEIVGRHFTELLTPESARVAADHFRRGLAGELQGMTPFFEVDVIRRDGTTVHAEVRAGDLVDHGRRVGRYGVGRDISELKRLMPRSSTSPSGWRCSRSARGSPASSTSGSDA